MAEIAQQQIFTLEKKVGTDAKSPMFAQLANLYLEQNRAEDALRVCDAGLANFPFYTTGHLIKGKALVALHMKAEARREFEFVLEFLPRNEMVSALLEQIQPGGDETLTIPLHEEQPKVENRILPAPKNYPEQEFTFTGFDQPVQEQTIEPPQEPTSVTEMSFFDTITQTPVAKTTDDMFGIAEPSVETPEVPELPTVSEFETPTQESPLLTETQTTAFEDIPRSAPEPISEYEFPLAAVEEEGITQAPSEEESFALYASRRRAELKGENTVSLEDYLSNTMVVPPEEVLLEFPTSTDVKDKTDVTILTEKPLIDSAIFAPQISANVQDRVNDAVPTEEQLIDNTISLPQIPSDMRDKVDESIATEEQLVDLSALLPQMTEDVKDNIEEVTIMEDKLTDTTIVLPQMQPAELPLSDSIQNNIEEIANKLKGAGKITPVIDIAQKETSPASEQDLPASMGFVTPTLAEIYAKQGWFDDAIKAYKALARNKPGEKERFEKRIEELEKLKSQSKK